MPTNKFGLLVSENSLLGSLLNTCSSALCTVSKLSPVKTVDIKVGYWLPVLSAFQSIFQNKTSLGCFFFFFFYYQVLCNSCHVGWKTYIHRVPKDLHTISEFIYCTIWLTLYVVSRLGRLTVARLCTLDSIWLQYMHTVVQIRHFKLI